MTDTVTHECPFPECDWTHEYTSLGPDGYPIDDYPTARHYEREHGGRIRLQVVVEKTQVLGSRSPREVRKQAFERWDDTHHEVAYIRSEVLEEADDHDALPEVHAS